MKYSAEVIITLKDGVRDPQGAAVDTVLKRTGMEENAEVKVGKYFTLGINADNESTARKKLENICHEVLSNPVLESYQVRRFEKI
jgi:phosphoribosylformylglycinamidine synthase PurS subunit